MELAKEKYLELKNKGELEIGLWVVVDQHGLITKSASKEVILETASTANRPIYYTQVSNEDAKYEIS